MSVVRRIKDTYDARSRFVHHRQGLADLELLRASLADIWRFYVTALPEALRRGFATKQDFIAAIDQVKYA